MDLLFELMKIINYWPIEFYPRYCIHRLESRLKITEKMGIRKKLKKKIYFEKVEYGKK